MEEQRYCSYCGNRLEPDARFCSSCGRQVHREARTPEADAPTSRIPYSQPPEPQQQRPPWPEMRSQTLWQRGVEARASVTGPMLALAGVFLALFVVEIARGDLPEAFRALPVVVVVVLVASAVSYFALARRGEASPVGAVFNWSVVVLAAFATLMFLVS